MLRRYYLTDHLGSVRAVVDGGGSTTLTRDYYPFGLPMDGRHDEGSPRTPEDFTGHERDAETQLHYAGARYYLSAYGRWNATDPLVDKNFSDSPYAYAVGNPLRYIDPTGMDTTATTESGDEVTIEGEGEGLPSHPTGIVVTAERRSDDYSLQYTFNRISAGAGVGGALMSGAEYFHVRNGLWRGMNGEMYRLGWGGNQYAGSRNLVQARADAFHTGGTYLFALQVAATTLELGIAYKQQGNITKRQIGRSGLDIGASSLAFLGTTGLYAGSAYTISALLLRFSNSATFKYNAIRSTMGRVPATAPMSTGVGPAILPPDVWDTVSVH